MGTPQEAATLRFAIGREKPARRETSFSKREKIAVLAGRLKVGVDSRFARSSYRYRPETSGQIRRAAMRVMVLVKATEDSEKGFVPTPENMDMLEAMGRFNDELAKAGILRAADGLTPSSQGKRVAFDGAGRMVIDGPFAETKELVAGFWLWEVKDMEEAVAWVKRCPNPMPGPSEIEIRPLYEMDDLL
ncbi:YciI family protein [Dyella marensis]